MNLEKFTGLAENYAKARPGYAAEAVSFLYDELAPRGAVLADIGAGTGKLTELLARRGSTVYAVEPNADMRTKLVRLLASYPNARAVEGSAEHTTLERGSVDTVLCAQAFHWFDPEAFRAECGRILRPGGRVVILYNRDLDRANRVHEAEVIRREENIRRFFGGGMERAVFPNPRYYSREDWLAFMLSHSGSPRPASPEYAGFIDEMNAVFDWESKDGQLLRSFQTNVYYRKQDRFL
jgi:SAM-dependent methyltransferase